MATADRETEQLEPLLSCRETALILGVSMPTLRRVMTAGQLPSVVVGDRRLVEPAALRRFIAERREARLLPRQRRGRR